MIEKLKRNEKQIKLIAVFAVFTFTMVFHLMHSAMWGDEWVEYDFSRASILTGELYRNIVSTFQPPLYNVIMHFWLMLDESLVWFRLFNVIIGIGAGIFQYLSLKKLYNPRVSMIALISLAVCYRWVYCIQECSEYALNIGGAWDWICGLLSIMLIGCSIYIFRKKIDLLKKTLVLSFWIAYVLHYFLVQLHIYAMVAPNVSAVFFERYSLFYIPLACITLPVIFCETYEVSSKFDIKSTMKVVAGAGVLCLFISFYTMLGNWTKATDNQFAEIWMENKGWVDITYLVGPASHAFPYYLSRADGYQEEYLHNTRIGVDIENLPSRFWLWKLSWGNDYELAINCAEQKGYTIVDCSVEGSSDKLTFCYLE